MFPIPVFRLSLPFSLFVFSRFGFSVFDPGIFQFLLVSFLPTFLPSFLPSFFNPPKQKPGKKIPKLRRKKFTKKWDPFWKYNCYELSLSSTTIWPIHAKYIKTPQSLVITDFNWMNASGNQGCIALPFVISRMSLSYGGVLIRPFCISLRFSPHDPILTGHQALAPSGPMLLSSKSRSVRVEFCFRASANAWKGRRHMT